MSICVTHDESSTFDSVGDAAQLFAELYRRLRKLAAAQMAGQRRSHTLQATALVNEVYLKLVNKAGWTSKGHFMASAAKAMRSILVDHARGKRRRKRSADGSRIPLDAVLLAYEGKSADILALDEALDALASRDAAGREAAQVVELRFFCGLSIDEIAAIMELGRRSVDRRWALARAELKRRL